MDDPIRHSRYAGRRPAGSELPVTVAKKGNRHIRKLPGSKMEETLSIGLACSECFSGPRLAKLLRPGFEYERQVMEKLMAGEFAAPLSIHTSAGVPEALSGFIEALEQHVPWKKSSAKESNDDLDWFVSLQVEGASAVWAGVDMLLQERMLTTGETSRMKVAVADFSYHGPPSTSFGSKSPLWQKHHQLKYPVPTPGQEILEADLLEQFEQFLKEHANEIGVLLMEPQWGSSQAAFPWPKTLLKKYIGMAQSYGVRVLADEIMCGLGRHGQGTVFLSKAWDLNPDAVTFGKAIAGGVFPLSGVIVKKGCELLQAHQCSVMQSHTYAGSSVRALMMATQVLKELPAWLPSIEKHGEEMGHIFRYLSQISGGMMDTQGQGLMWGGLLSRKGQNKDETFRSRTFQCFQKHCQNVGILPYFVPVGGFMVTPLVDVDIGTIYEIGEKLEEAILKTMKEMKWEDTTTTSSGSSIGFWDPVSVTTSLDNLGVSKLHETKCKALHELHVMGWRSNRTTKRAKRTYELEDGSLA